MSEIIAVDSSSIISLAGNCLLCVFEKFKKEFDVRFLIGERVLGESITRAVESRKFRLEGMRVKKLVDSGIIEIVKNQEVRDLTAKIMEHSNKCYRAKNENLKIIHWGEAEMLAISKVYHASTVLIDERITRMLVEKPEELRKLQEERLHTPVEMSNEEVRAFKNLISNASIARSTELCAMGFESGFFKEFEAGIEKNVLVIEGILWSLKNHGCAISGKEIKSYVKMLN